MRNSVNAIYGIIIGQVNIDSQPPKRSSLLYSMSQTTTVIFFFFNFNDSMVNLILWKTLSRCFFSRHHHQTNFYAVPICAKLS